MAIRSAALAGALNDAAAGGGVGQALVELDTGQADGNFVYDAAHVNHLLLMLNNDATADAAGPC